MKIYASAEKLIGRTPLVELSRFAAAHGLKARLIAKVEYMNPAGSSKDRVGLNMIDAAEAAGVLKPGATIIEPTSGNTGIGLAMVAALRGYKLVLVMPDTMSVERRTLLKAYGAEIVLSEGAKGMSGAIAKAEELAAEIPDSFIPAQFDNPANPQAHYNTTGPEIWADTDGEIDAFVAGIGTGGTLSGAGKFLREQKADIMLIGAEPAGSAVLNGGAPGPHGLQGIGAGFVPAVLDTEIYDEVLTITDEEAFALARELGKTEALLCGISSGAALAAALKVAERPEMAGKTIVVLLPDTGMRYLSTALFAE